MEKFRYAFHFGADSRIFFGKITMVAAAIYDNERKVVEFPFHRFGNRDFRSEIHKADVSSRNSELIH